MPATRLTLALLLLASPALADLLTSRTLFPPVDPVIVDLENRVRALEAMEYRRAIEESARLGPEKSPREKAEEERARLKLCGWFPDACRE